MSENITLTDKKIKHESRWITNRIDMSWDQHTWYNIMFVYGYSFLFKCVCKDLNKTEGLHTLHYLSRTQLKVSLQSSAVNLQHEENNVGM